jgi:hypothetical protein
MLSSNSCRIWRRKLTLPSATAAIRLTASIHKPCKSEFSRLSAPDCGHLLVHVVTLAGPFRLAALGAAVTFSLRLLVNNMDA